MATCAACGRENPEDARFCNACGATLKAPAPAREERKVVTRYIREGEALLAAAS